MLIEALRSIPLMGWGMRGFEFIFLARKWKIDRPRIRQALQQAQSDKTPLWLLVFPEGTLVCEETKPKSIEYAKKKDIVFEADHVLLPKCTGLFHILRSLRGRAEYLYDITIGYSGHAATEFAYDKFPLDVVFFEGRGPRAIHLHVDRFQIGDIPGISNQAYDPEEKVPPEFEQWLYQRFVEKNALLQEYYRSGTFPDTSNEGIGFKQSLHVSPEVQDWISLAGLVMASVFSFRLF
ncbi:hypothetical protein HDU91_006446 [Kappamyces sp. JEL0680]|nr:hypothetical protein HDU91_006446 [Kappamyces sp. JEL0680]